MNRLIYAASEGNADLFYATRFLAPDPFLYFEKNGRRHIALSSLEFGRARKQAQVDEVILQPGPTRHRRGRLCHITTPDWIASLLKKRGLRAAWVSPSFPLGLADNLRRRGLKLKVAPNGLFPERETKRPHEIAAIRRALKVTAELLKCAMDMIRRSRARRDGVLMLNGDVLTSERIQACIRTEAARRGYEAIHPIVAGGKQACDPHERGHGPLRARELIILDIFPRDLKTGYWGDMTRTVIKGRASDAQRRQFQTVRQAQKLAISRLRAGVDGRPVHQGVEKFFQGRGYSTSQSGGQHQGFFHGTGHGLGLEIHERPRIGAVHQKLRAGHVVTVEPGLYYPVVGGVRIEDVALVERGGCRLLSYLPVRLEID